MALKTLVKVGEVTNLTDARYAAGMEVDFVGFPINGENAISYEDFLAITGWLEGVQFVGEFTNLSADEILKINEKYELEFVQTDIPENVNLLKEADINVFLKLDIANLERKITGADYVLIDSSIEKPFKKEVLDSINSEVILGYGIETSNLNEILNHKNIKGIQLKGGQEERPGYKDLDELADILEALEVEEY